MTRSDYTLGEDGNWYNADGERVYYWVSPAETDSSIGGGSETQGIGQDLGGYYTEAEIKSAWDADEGMGYLKEQTDWDNYWGFVSERQGEIQAGNLVDPIQGDYAGQAKADGVANTDANYQSNSGRDEEVYYAQVGANTQLSQQDQMAGFVDQNADLMNKYGIQSEITNGDGDTFKFNGSTYSRTNKVDDHGFYGELGAGLMLGAFGAALGPAMLPQLTGATAGAAKGAIGSAVSQGMLTGSIDPGEVLRAGVTGGALTGFSDYLADSANQLDGSDLAGIAGKGGLLEKAGIGSDYLSTSAGIKALDAAANNPIISGAQKILAPVLNSSIGQAGLDVLTSAMMDGYNDEWEEHYDPTTGALDSGASDEDFQNFNRFTSAFDAGKELLATGQSLDGSPIWRLDERYPWTSTPRDPNSSLVGILDTPLEDGGVPNAPSYVINPPAIETEEETSNGKGGAGTGTDKGDGDGKDSGDSDDLNQSSEGGSSPGLLADITGGGADQGSNSGIGAGAIDDDVALPGGNSDQVVINQLIEAINLETDPDVQAGLQDDLNKYLDDQTLPESQNSFGPQPIFSNTPGGDVVLPPGVTDQQLPPSSSNGGGSAPGPGPGLLLSLAAANGLPPLWTDLDPYTKFRTYKSERTKLLDGMLSSLSKQEPKRSGKFVPRTPSEKELFEAGMLT